MHLYAGHPEVCWGLKMKKRRAWTLHPMPIGNLIPSSKRSFPREKHELSHLCLYLPSSTKWLPWWFRSKESAYNAEDTGNPGLIPGSGRSPGGGHGNPLQYSSLENPMDRGAWWATVHEIAKNQTRWSDWAHSTWVTYPGGSWDLEFSSFTPFPEKFPSQEAMCIHVANISKVGGIMVGSRSHWRLKVDMLLSPWCPFRPPSFSCSFRPSSRSS